MLTAVYHKLWFANVFNVGKIFQRVHYGKYAVVGLFSHDCYFKANSQK